MGLITFNQKYIFSSFFHHVCFKSCEKGFFSEILVDFSVASVNRVTDDPVFGVYRKQSSARTHAGIHVDVFLRIFTYFSLFLL